MGATAFVGTIDKRIAVDGTIMLRMESPLKMTVLFANSVGQTRFSYGSSSSGFAVSKGRFLPVWWLWPVPLLRFITGVLIAVESGAATLPPLTRELI